MDLVAAVKARRSIRAFKPDPVPKQILEEIADTARWCPSWENIQPWELTIIGGEKMSELRRELIQAADEPAHPDIAAPRFGEPYLTRRRNLGQRLVFDTLKIAREDTERRRWWRFEGLGLFHAPSAIFATVDRSLNSWSIFDAGMLSQTLMLCAQHYGLGTCIQASPVMYPDVIRRVTGIPENKLIVIAIAIGYPDWDNPVNHFEREREEVAKFVSWCGL